MLLMCPLRIVSELQRSSSSSSSLSCCLPLTLHLSLSASRLLASFGGRKSFIDFVTVGGGLTLLSTAIFCCFSLGLVSNSIQSSENSLPKCLQWHVLDYRSDVVLAAVSISLSLAISFAVCRQSRYVRACPICLLFRAFHYFTGHFACLPSSPKKFNFLHLIKLKNGCISMRE